MVRHGETKSGAGHVTAATVITCEQCGGGAFVLSTLMDDPNDITQDAAYAALLISYTGGSAQGFVGKCHYCGHEQVPLWYITDVAASDGTKLVMTNLDQATTANLLAGKYAICCCGTDTGKYFTISTNTAAAPTHITPTVAPNADDDGIWIITNILPFGLTAAS